MALRRGSKRKRSHDIDSQKSSGKLPGRNDAIVWRHVIYSPGILSSRNYYGIGIVHTTSIRPGAVIWNCPMQTCSSVRPTRIARSTSFGSPRIETLPISSSVAELQVAEVSAAEIAFRCHSTHLQSLDRFSRNSVKLLPITFASSSSIPTNGTETTGWASERLSKANPSPPPSEPKRNKPGANSST